MIDASIPLQVRPTIQQVDPVEQYGRMLSLKHMQAQEARQRQLDPLVLQQHQAALKMANLQAADMERQVQKEKDIARITGEAYGTDKPADSATPEAAPSSAKPDPSTPPAAAATLQPATALQADAGELPGAAPPPTSATLRPLATMGGPAAAPPLTPNSPSLTSSSPSPRETADQKFARLMNAAGHGQDVPRILQNRAVAKDAQFKMQEMERDQNDAQIWETAGKKSAGDPAKALQLATEAGMSQKTLGVIRKNMQDAVNAHLLERSRLSDAEKKEREGKEARGDQAADRIAGFLKRDDQGMKANWKNFVEQLFKDGISTEQEHAEAVKLNGGEFPGRAAVQGILDEHASHKWVKEQAAVQLAAAKEKQAEQDRQERLKQARERLDIAAGRGNSPGAELIRQRRQQIIDAGEQKKWEDLDKSKAAGEKDLRGKRDAEVAKLLKDTGFDTEGQASEALAAKTASVYSKKQAQKAVDAIKGINRKYAPQLQGVQDRYANSIRARKGKAVDYDVDPDTLAYKERAVKAGAVPDEAAPPAEAVNDDGAFSAPPATQAPPASQAAAPPKAQAGAQIPADVAAKVPEGRVMKTPDGARWRKVNGQMVKL